MREMRSLVARQYTTLPAGRPAILPGAFRERDTLCLWRAVVGEHKTLATFHLATATPLRPRNQHYPAQATVSSQQLKSWARVTV
jgi:hypothetical protein